MLILKIIGNLVKSKSIAIVFALFFSFWSWLYTYKKNILKFWLIFGLNILALIVILITGIIFISATTEGHPEFNEYLKGFETFFHSESASISQESYRTFSIILLALAITGVYEIGVWVWTLIDYAIKPTAFFNSYR